MLLSSKCSISISPQRFLFANGPSGPFLVDVTTFDAVTTFADAHWDTHARRCVESFDRHWQGVRLMAYRDVQLEASSAWLRPFKACHAALPTTNYRFDAVRFAHKVAAIELAYASGTAQGLVWMDADCVTHADVDAAWLSGLLGNADFGYLRRSTMYSECGFMIFRRGPACGTLLRRLVDLYRTDALFQLAEWHDSFAIDHVRRQCEAAGEMTCVSLSGGAENTKHPMVNGPLGARLDHLKGARKQFGRSHRRDLARPRSETYWKSA